ncbi:MAG: nitroreductase/quinone reductase family protein, partial [Dehalococcoidia bacterium]
MPGQTADPTRADQDYCYVTTTGRVTGNPHTIEIWFAMNDSTIYILAGGRYRSDCVRNAKKAPRVGVRIAGHTFEGGARI